MTGVAARARVAEGGDAHSNPDAGCESLAMSGDLEGEFLFLLPTDGPPHALGAIGIDPRIEPSLRRLT